MRFEQLTDEQQIRDLIEWHNTNSAFVVIDTETTDKDPRKAKLIDIQMSGVQSDHAVAFGGNFLPLLLGLNVTQVWQNFKYDWKVALAHGVDFRGKPMRDTMLLHHLVDENADHDLDSWVKENYGDDYKEKFWKEYTSYLSAPIERRIAYGCADIYYTQRFYESCRKRLGVDGIPDSLVEHVHRLALALFDTEVTGIGVDLDYTVTMGAQLKEDIVKLEGELRQIGGIHCDILEYEAWSKEIQKHYKPGPRATKWKTLPKPEFNFAAPAQVCALLYDRLELPAQIDRKTKNPTADDKALEAIESKHPIVPKIRQLRKYSKMYGSFVEGVLDKVQDGRIYPGFNINGTVTGRISHHGPNMGQMPSKGDWVKIRGIFVPDEGCDLGTADYGQLEVCIAAHFSLDKNLLKIVLEGASQHDITAEGLGVPRSTAKTINFAMQYGATSHKIKEILNCSEKDAQLALAKYWETYSGLKTFIDWCHGQLEAGRPIVNPYGRKRRFPTKFENRWELESAKRQVFSSLIQGTGGDMMSDAFYTTHEALKARGWGRGWFTVHDEGLIEAKRGHFEEAIALLVQNMLAIGPKLGLRVPLKVEPSERLSRWQK